MKLDEFIANFAELFDDTDVSEITPKTIFMILMNGGHLLVWEL